MSDHKSPKCSLCNKAGHNKRSCKEISEKAAKKTHKKIKKVIEEIKEEIPEAPKKTEEQIASLKENLKYFMESKQLINAIDNFCAIDGMKGREELIGFIDKRISEIQMDIDG